jgi:hypothetical protein
MARRTWQVVAVIVAVLLTATAQLAGADNWGGEPPQYQIELRYWLVQDLFASTRVDGALAGANLDLRRDLKIDKDNIPELRFVWMPTDVSTVRIGYTRLRFEGNRVAPFDFFFNDLPVAAGDTVRSRVRGDYYYVNWAIQAGGDTFRLGPIFGLHGWTNRVGVEDRSVAGHPRTERTFNNVIPAVGLAVDWSPAKVITFFFDGSGMHQGAEGWHLDAEAGVKVYPIKNLAFVGSYRRLEINNDRKNSENFIKYSVRGPFVGFDVRF